MLPKPDRCQQSARKLLSKIVLPNLFLVRGNTNPGLWVQFWLFVKSKTVHDKLVPFVCLISPALCFLISTYSKELLGDYVIDNELIILNGLITFVGLFLISKPATKETRF